MKKQHIIGATAVTALVISISSLSILSAQAAPIVGDPVLGSNDPIMGSKHDFTGLNTRAGVTAMAGVAFADYGYLDANGVYQGYSCVYCHVPPDADRNPADVGLLPDQAGGIPDWNRFVPATDNYRLYSSSTLDNLTNTPNSISMLCLSCHDGTMSVDMVVFKPRTYDASLDQSMHMRINASDNIDSCGKCHNGQVAHDIAVKELGTDLTNDHPISMRYAGLTFTDPDFRYPNDPATGFSNGVKLYNGMVECASCHNVHDPSKEVLLRERAELICFTCHLK